MCPACISTVTLAVVGATSTGGLAALVVRKLRGGKGPKKSPRPPEDGAMARPKVGTAKGD